VKPDSFIPFLILALLLTPLFANTVLNIDQPIRNTDITHEQLKDAIISAAAGQQWSIMPDGPALIATYRKSDYMAKVRITYSPRGYTIGYADSQRLHYDGRGIHPTYNRLIKRLQAGIVRNIKSIQQHSEAAAQQTTLGEGIKAKLRKLKELYEEALITKEEYDAKRKELLDSY